MPDLLVGRVRVAAQARGDGDDEPRSAEPALQAVAVAERPLHGRQLTVARVESLERGHLRAIGLHREHETGANRGAVEQHRARATRAVLAAEVRACEMTAFS